MQLLDTASFGPQNITSEFAITQFTPTADIAQLAVVLWLRGLAASSATRELRIYLDGQSINGVSTADVPAHQPGGVFAETHGQTATRLSVIVPAVVAGRTVDVRVRSQLGGDTAVHGTCELFNLDVLTPAQVTALLAELHQCKAALVNRQAQTIATGVVQFFDDDGVTVVRTLTPTVNDPDAPTQNILVPS